MGINLPKWEELSKDEQIPIVNLPLEGNFVVVGGPGTGKTILALYRAARWKSVHKDNKEEVKFLVYNRPLRQFISDAISTMELPESSVDTWYRWLFNFYREVSGQEIPSLGPYKYDFDKIELFFQKNTSKYFDYLILDEAQDLPPALLRILNTISKSVTVFGDSKQALDNELSKTADLTHAFGAERRVFYLSQNYRNTKEISDLAHIFYTGDSNDIPARSSIRGPKPRYIRVKDINKSIEIIRTYSENNPSQTIGVFFHETKRLLKYKNIFEELGVKNIQIYKAKALLGLNHFSFDTPGIKIMTFSSMKGLEFDAVFIPEIDDIKFDSRDTLLLKRMYVGSTRAKKNLTFIASSDKETIISKMLDSNPDLIEIIIL